MDPTEERKKKAGKNYNTMTEDRNETDEVMAAKF